MACTSGTMGISSVSVPVQSGGSGVFSDTNPPPAWTFSWFRNNINANLNVFFYIRSNENLLLYPSV